MLAEKAVERKTGPREHKIFSATISKTGIGCRPYLLQACRHRRLSWHRLEHGIGYRS
jgi:hypothetical protein